MLLSCLLQCRGVVFPRTSEVSFGESPLLISLRCIFWSCPQTYPPLYLHGLGPTVRAKTREQQHSQHPALEQLTPWKPGYFPKVSKPLVQVKGMFFHVRTTDPHRNITGMGYMNKKQQLFFLLKEANIMQNRKLYSINGTKNFWCIISKLRLFRVEGRRGEERYMSRLQIELFSCSVVSYPLRPRGLQFSSVQLLRCVRIFETPCTAARQASLSITNSKRLLKLMSIESVMSTE